MTKETDMSAQLRNRQGLMPRPEAEALDAWVRLSLGQRFDATLAEKPPSELMALACRFA
jgi:hypothetical protein